MTTTTTINEIDCVLDHYLAEANPRTVGRIDVGLLLYGILLEEARDTNRFLSPQDTEIAEDRRPRIRGWPIVPDHNRKPMEWAIVPA